MNDGKNSKGVDRRKFLGQVGIAAAVGRAIARPPAALAKPSATGTAAKPEVSCALAPGYPPVATTPLGAAGRITQATILRDTAAANNAGEGPAVNLSNGDSQIYTSKLGTYTKGLVHNKLGLVNPASYQSMISALESGSFSAFQNIITGGQTFPSGQNHTLNGPQGGLCFDLEKADNVQFGQPQVPPAPSIASDQSATELVEHYWGALCRDVSFIDYGTGTGTDSKGYTTLACNELSAMSCYTGPRNGSGQVTANLLFRGNFPGEIYGPYMSQFMLLPTSFGAQPISQQWNRFQAGVDYMTDFQSYLKVQDGWLPTTKAVNEPGVFYATNGRALATWTHSDVLYQGYFIALLVLGTLGAALNPGNPYLNSKSENGFSTFGPPDFAATVGELAARALNVVWYQKWWVHLRSRPEEGGGIVQLNKTGLFGGKGGVDVKMSDVVLNSVAAQTTFNNYGTWLLPQAFPEGSPTHPSYPTGHGTVGGACITLLKFFFDGNFVIANPMQASADGTTLTPYVAPPGEPALTVNGELNKLGHNISYGHGIHAGIHWRSDSDTSLLLGEQIAIDFLNSKAACYNEPFSITIQKFDGTNYTFNNPGHP